MKMETKMNKVDSFNEKQLTKPMLKARIVHDTTLINLNKLNLKLMKNSIKNLELQKRVFKNTLCNKYYKGRLLHGTCADCPLKNFTGKSKCNFEERTIYTDLRQNALDNLNNLNNEDYALMVEAEISRQWLMQKLETFKLKLEERLYDHTRSLKLNRELLNCLHELEESQKDPEQLLLKLN